MSEVLQGAKETVTEKIPSAVSDTFKNVSTMNAKTVDLRKNTVGAGESGRVMTTDHGVKVQDTDNWLKVVDEQGRPGPSLLEDQIAREKIHRFDHEEIPERVVHARGTGAHGYFRATNSKELAKYTTAKVLTDESLRTPMFVRFSTVLGSRGSADTVRDVRGFALKFYTNEGNWDIVGNNIPVFFIQDAMKFPDVIHAAKPEPHNDVPQAQTAHNNFWDFQYLHSEATHMFMWAMSDRAIPRSYRMMQGFGVNTFSLINEHGERTFVKFVWTPRDLGVHSLVWDEALKLAGQDPDFHRKDLMEAIENGAYPTWTLYIQTCTEEKAADPSLEFDILDATKIWPEDEFPLIEVGEFTLDRNVDEFFAETEQVAFCTSHVVPGIGFSDDPLLQGRNFSYFDTQISRLGINWEQLPINRPICPVMNFNRAGAMNHTIHKGKVNYWPNRFEATPHAKAIEASTNAYHEFASSIIGSKQRLNGAKFKEHFKQAQLFYNSLSEYEKLHVQEALAFELDHCDEEIVYKRMVERLADINLELAQAVAERVGGDIPTKANREIHNKTAPHLSQLELRPQKPTIATRRIAFLIADGFDLTAFTALRAAFKALQAVTYVIAPRRHTIYPAGVDKSSSDKGILPDHHFEGMRSTMFDAILLCPGQKAIDSLRDNGRVVQWVREAFGHLKAIGAMGDAVSFLKEAAMLPNIELALDANSDEVVTSYGVVTTAKTEVGAASGSVAIEESKTSFASAFAHAISLHRCYERELDGLIKKVAF